MKLLALYTASDPGSVAVTAGERELARSLAPARQLEGLVPAALELLAQTGLRVRELDGIAVARGPGSFTGLRVGAATALGLARGAGLDLYGAGTLEIWAALAGEWWTARHARSERIGTDEEPPEVGDRTTGLCRVVLNARRGEVYAAGFRYVERRLELLDGPVALSPAQALSRVEAGALVVGDGRELLVAEGLDPTRPGFVAPPSPLALALGRLVLRDPPRFRCAPGTLDLEYVRDAQAVAARPAAGRKARAGQ